MSEHNRPRAIAHGRDEKEARLVAPARYFPPRSGRYQVNVGLARLGSDFGNGEADAKALQIDRSWPRYRREKARRRRSALAAHVGTCGAEAAIRAAAVAVLARRLAAEHPARFRLDPSRGGCALVCRLSGERLDFDPAWNLRRLTGFHARVSGEPPYRDALDALACQVQEDLALVRVDPDGSDRLVYLHVCFPAHWDPAAKLGGDFATVHAPVPDFARIAARSAPLLRHLVEGGDMVRFIWGLAGDRRLSHHPAFPAPCGPPSTGLRLWLRVERQVTLGLPQAGGFLFLIRTYLRPVTTLQPEEREALAAAVADMSEEALAYKGYGGQREALITALRAPPHLSTPGGT